MAQNRWLDLGVLAFTKPSAHRPAAHYRAYETTEAYFRLLPTPSKQDFQTVIGAWQGRLVADAYGVYLSWLNDRHSCLAHPLRRAQALAESSQPEIAAFGTKVGRELRRLVRMNRAPPTVGVWGAWLARFKGLLRARQDRDDDAGKLARYLLREDAALWAFLRHPDVDPTNNHGERQIRPGVQWRKRRQGTRNQTGVTRVERGITLHQTCRLRDASVYDVLVDAFEAQELTAIPKTFCADVTSLEVPIEGKREVTGDIPWRSWAGGALTQAPVRRRGPRPGSTP